MQPPPARPKLSMPSSARSSPGSEAGIGKIQALHQDADEGAVELAATVGRRLAEVCDLHLHDEAVARRDDRGAALMVRARKVSHLAEAIPGAQHRKQLLVLRHPGLALDHHAEEVAMIALAHDRRALRHLLPRAERDHLPELWIGECREELHAAQRGE